MKNVSSGKRVPLTMTVSLPGTATDDSFTAGMGVVCFTPKSSTSFVGLVLAPGPGVTLEVGSCGPEVDDEPGALVGVGMSWVTLPTPAGAELTAETEDE